ncbi:leucine rich repeat (LRR) protein [Pseudomonas sp. 2848]|jgi:hypothetical protein|uniref:NEL-type E3 ubiquitin ligase domain-containing protein n=1 Tax=Pseudomonas sp. 2848 TaxID=2183926 RepID=UPI000DAD66FE|nr:NEL-type E3 ubiquitin ligase domain-containing protein [Pseudomonas sp. 2848]PZW82246.1 leucine rich repeat (LRR) protein [Pseudomonas sp. 2848]
MPTDSDSGVAQSDDTLRLEQAFQDGLIAKRLPEWLHRLGDAPLAELSAALKTSLDCRQRLQTRWGRVQGIEAFVGAALQDVFDKRFTPGLDVGTLWFRQGYPVPLRGQYFTTRVPVSGTDYAQVPLVEAILRNFVASESMPNGQPRGNGLFDEAGGRLDQPSAIGFARLCRELDAGARYQRHLDAVLDPPGEQSMRELLARLLHSTLVVDACKANADGILSAAELNLLLRVCRNGEPQALDGAPVVVKQLRVLECALEQIIVFDVVDQGWLRNTSKRILCYIPGDPHGPWSAHPDLEHLSHKRLGRHLRDGAYLKFFSRFLRRRDSHRFFSAVIELYRDVAIWATRDLQVHMRPMPQPLFDHLAAARIAQIKDDAAVIAPPVAQLDRAVQQAHDRYLAAQGWLLVGLAGFFIPVVGAALLAVFAWDLLTEVFHGVEDWQDGDTSAALDHLTHVVRDLAVVAATAAGVSAVRHAWGRSLLVDSLVPAQMENGETKLWNQDLAAYRSEAPPLAARQDSDGVQRLAGQAFIEMDGQHYPVQQHSVDGAWQLRPRAGFGPVLRGNGAGAWRLASAQPSCWQGARLMFRRLGRPFSELDAARVDAALSIHGIGTGNLRVLHMENQVPDPWLCDSVERLLLEARIGRAIMDLRSGVGSEDHELLRHARRLSEIPGLEGARLAGQIGVHRRRLLQALYDSGQEADTVAIATLRRIFTGLHRRAAQALLEGADADDYRRLVETGRIPMRLAESARASVARIRTVRVLEALHYDMPQSADLARVVIGLLEGVTGASRSIRWRLLDEHVGGTALVAGGDPATATGLLHLDGRFVRLDPQGNTVGEAGDLFEVMAAAYDADQLTALGLDAPFAASLRLAVRRRAVADRQAAERLLSPARPGALRAPSRLQDGRFGYLLSGRQPGRGWRRGRPQALIDRVHGLFPALEQAELDRWISAVQASGRPVEEVLATVRAQSELLRQHMDRWIRSVSGGEAREQRRYFGDALMRCWQRSTFEESVHRFPPIELWWSQMGARPGVLPELPDQIRLSRVAILSLRGMELEAVPDSFLQAFANLRVLELPGNRLTRLPAQLQHMRQLQCLDLCNNQIALDPGQSAVLAGCEALTYLNLSHNPLGRTFSVHAMTQLNELRLSGSRIAALPHGTLECQRLVTLDVRDNLITALPEGFYQAQLWTRGRVWLQGNPLTSEQRQRLLAALALPVAPVQLIEPDIPARMRWLDAIEDRHRDELGSAWALVDGNEHGEAFFDLLTGLTESADFRSPVGARDLAFRVLEMLQAMDADAELCNELFACARDVTCQDSITLRFSDLEVRLLVRQAQQGSVVGNRERALLHLGRQLWRLDAVDRIALEDVQARRAAGGNPDEIEVVLAYRLALRRDLDLPLRINDMLFRDFAGVGMQQVAQARERVLAAESSETVARSLAERDFWCRHLRHVYQARFDAFNAPYHARVEALMADRSLSEAARLEQIGQVQETQALAERTMMLEMTRHALELVVEQEIFVR